MNYARPAGASASDFENARAGETLVAGHLPLDVFSENFDSPDEMDFVRHSNDIGDPEWALDVKEKNQPITWRWLTRFGGTEPDAFILDELSVRKALQYGHRGYFVLGDKPRGRWFLASAIEIVCGDHVRLDRVGPTGWAKGKWVIDLRQYREVPLLDLWSVMQQDQNGVLLGSQCLKGES